jgi:hypothetical protein
MAVKIGSTLRKVLTTLRSRGKAINTWVQTSAIIAAGIWAIIYTVVYKEVLLPATAPVNISVDLAIKQAAVVADAKRDLIAVEMKIIAVNPSSRILYLLPSPWVASGYTVAPRKIVEQPFAQEDVSVALLSPTGRIERHSEFGLGALVAIGRLFSNTVLNPGEKLQRIIVFHVPPATYDMLDVMVTMTLTTTNPSGFVGKWSINPTNRLLRVTWFRVGKDQLVQLREPEVEHWSGKLGLQRVESIAELSLGRPRP